ncbi:hypothetical protein JTB14_035779 [Gonioctena quinquepunctata]|nr:hypothetical protein JTB14_035779 [Gonioctena quinquepunctata]
MLYHFTKYYTYKIDGAASSVPMKKNHVSVDAKEHVKTIYSSLPKRGLNTSAAATEIFDLTKLPLTTVKNHIKLKRKRKDDGPTKCFDEGDKNLIRQKVYTKYVS